MPDRTAAAGHDSKWHAYDDGEKQRKAGKFEMSSCPAEEFVRERFTSEIVFAEIRGSSLRIVFCPLSFYVQADHARLVYCAFKFAHGRERRGRNVQTIEKNRF